MKKKERVLLGSTVDIPDEIDPEENEHRADEGYLRYSLMDVIDSIGDSFKITYMSAKNIIANTPIKLQIIFCMNIIDKIKEVYDFELVKKFEIFTLDDVQEVYYFIEFLEYDYVEFLIDLWLLLKDSPKGKDLEDYCQKNAATIMDKIGMLLDARIFPVLVSEFLRTNIRDNLVKFVQEKTEKSKVDVLIGIMERSNNGKG